MGLRGPFILGSLLLSLAGFGAGDSLSGNIIIGTIKYTGNKVTKPQIITRELMFGEGDTIPRVDYARLVQKSRENLLNTSLFNFVTVDTASAEGGKIAITLTFAERWYTWPVPIFDIAERNFNTWWETRDLSRAIYGFYITRDNFRGRKESLTFRVKLGYIQQLGLSYNIPYITRKQNSGLGFALSYSRGHEIAYNTFNNKLLYYKDPAKFVKEETAGRLTYTYRQGIYNTHYGQIGYVKSNIADTVLNLANDYFTDSLPMMEYLSLQYIFRRDYRDSKVYPLKGYYVDFVADKLGLGALKKENLDLLYFQATVKQYWKMGRRFYPAVQARGRVSLTHDQPYYTQRALGFRDYVRAYEYYVVDGQNYALAKAQLRYEVIKPRVLKIPFLPFEKFNKIPYSLYIGAFCDAAWVEDRINYQYNPLANTWLFGAGFGLDLYTYYDGVFRVEYSFNRMGESGFFLHLSSPI